MHRIIIAFIGLAVLVGCKSKDSVEAVKTQNTEAAAVESPTKEAIPNSEAQKLETAKEAVPEIAAQNGHANPSKEAVPNTAVQNENTDTPKEAELPSEPLDEDEESGEEEDYTIPQDGTIEEKMAGLKWELGHVGRFDFDYEAPGFMKEMPAPANNDGSTYAWKDMVFLVWGAHDSDEGNVQKAFDSKVEFLGHAPHYKVIKSDNYIMSDYTKEGKIFYRKCIYKYELEFCEELQYPKEYKAAVEPIVKKIAAFDVTEEPDIF